MHTTSHRLNKIVPRPSIFTHLNHTKNIRYNLATNWLSVWLLHISKPFHPLSLLKPMHPMTFAWAELWATAYTICFRYGHWGLRPASVTSHWIGMDWTFCQIRANIHNWLNTIWITMYTRMYKVILLQHCLILKCYCALCTRDLIIIARGLHSKHTACNVYKTV